MLSQIKTKNKLLDNEEDNPYYKEWQGIWLNCTCDLVFRRKLELETRKIYIYLYISPFDHGRKIRIK